MATILLSAVGTSLGAAAGGSFLGLGSAVIGRAVGATVGRVIDERLLGGSQSVEHGRVDRFRISGTGQGTPMAQVFGRTRLAGQVIWSSRFLETRNASGGGKGTSRRPKTISYDYSVSIAVALCAGEITRLGRIWADGREIEKNSLNLRVYTGALDQLPDPKIEAVEGVGNAPAYRGTAYVVIEDLELGQFGNRVPVLNFEVVRPARAAGDAPAPLSDAIEGVALVPGSGEYALATTPVHYDHGLGRVETANMNAPTGKSDFSSSIEALREELPNCNSASLVVSWFGDDLRASVCTIKPKVEQTERDGMSMPWTVNGVPRSAAETVPSQDGRPVFGGTPADAAVVEAIKEMKSAGQHVLFYPFILMDQQADNILPDPWSGGLGQPAHPWRGRITTSLAPGVAGSPDKAPAAGAEVDAFFGTSDPGDFSVSGETVSYSGPAEWSYRRFILHYAHLCAAAGGVDAFCIGSEMRSLTQIRDGADSYPAVDKLIDLAADVRGILGASTKISYAADWSEYFGHQPTDGSGDVFFHLDPLWADNNIDFIGIDNYLPLSDWREGDDHADVHWGSIYQLVYLKSQILGGKYYNYYYASPEEELAQIRQPIADGAHGEDWVFRPKDFPNWWRNPHHNRPGGIRDAAPTVWVPEAKPIWFTEFGCPAVDKGTNEPNLFVDPKSSESALPRFSGGQRDDFLQAQYYRAMTEFWADSAQNPVSSIYSGPMVDMSKAHAWAWDTRPFPHFPSNLDLWSDGGNYSLGHWLSGRVGVQALAGVVAEICEGSGLTEYDVSELHGVVRGYAVPQGTTARAALQPLMLAYGFDAIDRDGKLVFRSRNGRIDHSLNPTKLAADADRSFDIEQVAAPVAELAGRVRLRFVEAEGDFAVGAVEAILPDEATYSVDQSEVPLVLTRAEARATVEQWLAEARVARDSVQLAVPPSMSDVGAGDIIALDDAEDAIRYRVDRAETAGKVRLEAVRVERNIYVPQAIQDEAILTPPYVAALPVLSQFLDLPILRGSEVPHAPHVAVSATPWPGSAAVYSSVDGESFDLNSLVEAPAIVGTTLTPLTSADPDTIDRGPGLQVYVEGGTLASVAQADMLNGLNLAAIGDGSSDNWEIIQFTDAVLIAENTWEISNRLRGQAGTDAMIPASWPAGSKVVFLDASVGQIELAASERGLDRVYRIGPGNRAFDDPAYSQETLAFNGIGLRPYRPTHIRTSMDALGEITLSWVRRTRIDGDSWQGQDVPVGEPTEAYHIRVLKNASLVREVSVNTPAWTYSAAEQAADAITAPFELEVAQVSDAWGAGPYRRITFDG